MDKNNSIRLDTARIGLKKKNLSVATVVFMIYCLCSGGAFGIEELIVSVGPGLTLIMLLALPFLWSAPLGLVASELGSARPQEGGYYKWVQEALGEFWGFQAGWWRTISIIWDISPLGLFLIKAAIIFIFTAINLRGIGDVGAVSTVFSILVLAAFILVTVVGVLNWNQNPFIPITADGEIAGFSGLSFKYWVYYIGTGISIAIWIYSGYESMSTIAGEIEDPQVIPKATMISLPLIAISYIVPTLVGLASVGQWESWSTVGTESVGYITVLSQFLHPGFAVLFVIIAVISNVSIYNTYIASGSRGFFCLAEDYLAPPVLAKVEGKRGIPYLAVLSLAIVNLILCNFAFEIVVVVDVFLLMSAYVLIFISALLLRKKIPDEERPFKIPGGYGFLVLLCVVPMIIAFIAFFINGTDFFIGGMVGIASGPVLYVIWKRSYGGLAKKDNVRYPVNHKTGLAKGDLNRMAFVFIWLSVMGVVAAWFLPWFEGDWGNEYYSEVYGTEGLFDTFITMIKMGSAFFCLLSAVLFIAAKKMEPKKARLTI